MYITLPFTVWGDSLVDCPRSWQMKWWVH